MESIKCKRSYQSAIQLCMQMDKKWDLLGNGDGFCAGSDIGATLPLCHPLARRPEFRGVPKKGLSYTCTSLH